jgi:hypothetical protein
VIKGKGEYEIEKKINTPAML